jgi:hypothetical protein
MILDADPAGNGTLACNPSLLCLENGQEVLRSSEDKEQVA